MKKDNYRKTGAHYEKIAGEYLADLGYKILECNFRCRAGEIDIIAEENGYLVFCEVKYRSREQTGHPLEAVDARKQKTLSKCALYYLAKEQKTDCLCRFDVIGIQGKDIILIKNAFDYSEL